MSVSFIFYNCSRCGAKIDDDIVIIRTKKNGLRYGYCPFCGKQLWREVRKKRKEKVIFS